VAELVYEREDTMPYQGYKVYGPYIRPDGRKHVICIKGEERITVSYPRYVIEVHLGRKLPKDLDVHHIDGNETNDDISNLDLRPHGLHQSEHGNHSFIQFICPVCEKTFELSWQKVQKRKSEQKRGKGLSGPYCSRKCSGKVNN
jgi:hypothetical protein